MLSLKGYLYNASGVMVEKNGQALQPVINYRSSDSYDVDDEGRLTVLSSCQFQ